VAVKIGTDIDLVVRVVRLRAEEAITARKQSCILPHGERGIHGKSIDVIVNSPYVRWPPEVPANVYWLPAFSVTGEIDWYRKSPLSEPVAPVPNVVDASRLSAESKIPTVWSVWKPAPAASNQPK
jgi:hypothetical protein